MKNSKPITKTDLENFDQVYRADPVRVAMTNALSKVNIDEMCYDAQAARTMVFKFSNEIKTMSATNQRGSGRCWLFAATNLLREKIAKALNIDSFELSQSYLAFYDKFERCNYYIESIIDTASLPVGDRVVDCIVETGISDGGQWDMFVNIIDKYGVCPKDAYPETFQSENTHNVNRMLNLCLRRNTPIIRNMIASGASKSELEEKKKEILSKCWSFLVSCYGEPPATFAFEYVDKDGKYHKDLGYTPITFRDKFVGDMLKDYVSIVNAPTADKPFDCTYTVKYLGNIIGGKDIKHLNLTIEDFKKAVLAQLLDGELVWFGSDCGKFSEGKKKIWDPDCFNYEFVTGLDTDLSKEDMLDYHVSQMNHAMVISGVNINENGVPDRWKIENSWGTDGPYGGYHMASDKWFDLFVYQAVVDKKYLGDKAALLEKTPIELNPWDPMGSLAE